MDARKKHIQTSFLTVAFLLVTGCLPSPPPPQDATLSGVFLLEEEEEHEGIEVILPGTAYRGYTNKEGKMLFDSLPPGEYEILAQAEGYEDYRESKIELAPGDHIFLGELFLSPHPTKGSIAGTVVLDGTKTARVEVRLLGANRTIESASDGRYEFKEVHPGRYDVAFYYPGYVSGDPLSVTVEAGSYIPVKKTTLKSIRADAMATGALEGVVTLEGLSDFSGIGVFVAGTPLAVETRSDGSFWLEGVESGTRTLLFEREGYESYRLSGYLIEAGTVNPLLPIELHRSPLIPSSAKIQVTATTPNAPIDPDSPGILSGYAFFPDREDHSGIRVRVLDPPTVVKTGSDGAFLISGLAPNLYALRAESEGFLADELIDVEVRPGEVTRVPQMELAFGEVVEEEVFPSLVYGQILLADAGPQPGISVSIEGANLATVTDREGRFAFEDVAPGEYEIVAALSGYYPFSEPLDVVEDEDAAVPVITLEPEEIFLEVVESDPRDGARKVEVSDRVVITVRFSERLLARTVEPNVSVSPSVTTHVTVPEVDMALIELIRTKQGGVQFETEYIVTLGTGIESPEGHRLEEPYDIRFKTGGPRILASIPANGARNVILMGHEPIILFVNEMIDTKDLEQKMTVRPETGEIPHVLARRTPFGARVEIQLPLREERPYRLNIPRTVRTVNDRRYENTPYTVRFRSGSYDDLPDASDLNAETLTEFEGLFE